MKNYIYKSIILSFGLLLMSCSSDDDQALDSQAPTVTINTPAEEQAFERGETITLDIDLEDDLALAAYRLNIHQASDGHTHNIATMSEAWEFGKNVTLENTPQTFKVEDEIAIPEDIEEGDYHFGIIVLDNSGNQTEAYLDIEIGEHHHKH